MHRDEEVRVRGAGARDAVAELDELIAIAREYGPHSGLCVDAVGERACDGERDVLLAGSAVPDGARVHATVAGIDRDDHVPIAIAWGVRSADGFRAGGLEARGPFRARRRCDGDGRFTEHHHELPSR